MKPISVLRIVPRGHLRATPLRDEQHCQPSVLGYAHGSPANGAPSAANVAPMRAGIVERVVVSLVLLGALSWVVLDGGPVALVVFLAAVCLTPFWLARRGAR